MRILITAIDSATAMSVAKGFLYLDMGEEIYLIGSDVKPEEDVAGKLFVNEYKRLPLAKEEKWYIENLRRLIKMQAIDIVIPCSDIEVEIISKYMKLLSDLDCLFCVPSYKSAVYCNDKLLTHELFKELKVPTPRTLTFNEGDLMPGKQIIKDRFGVGSKGIYFDYQQLLHSNNKFIAYKDYIIQDKLEGDEFTADVFCDGKTMIACVPRWRREVRDGKTWRGETFSDVILEYYCKLISEKLEIKGICCIQGFCKNGTFKFTEINCRPSATLILTTEAGINMCEYIIDMRNGKEMIPTNEFVRGLKVLRFIDEDFTYP